ncbi:DUF262 domain-containing protein [Sulfurospirillum sp. UCH001]|uniref:DUF262 domain-containing protein n=1 Tax=Sulfurospirillum sp. UCH001 TaxID=1581011 RepID=UPI00082AFAF9|nr:DUF262 domain-containing protein [Sulfurospirillum sp. UCH001]
MESNEIIKVKDLLNKTNLQIPEYQRPYKWDIYNINQLIDDILRFNDKETYRLGTIVLHKENEKLNIVDGQQRTISLLLIYHALKEVNQRYVGSLTINFDWKFKSDISKFNIQNNYQAIKRRANEFDEKTIKFIFEKCEIVVITLNDLTEAFQFFDSQNARGKDLDPHDLLKAYHLREMDEVEEKEKIKIIKTWEDVNPEELTRLFEDNLFRIRQWSKTRSARFFTKKDIGVFKGFNLHDMNEYMYSKIQVIANSYINHYNQEYIHQIDSNTMNYPFQIDQTIINGKRFFEMVTYYKKFKEKMKEIKNEILILLDSYESKSRTGDKYVRILFDCALMYYIDRFGEVELDKAIEKFFIWAYSLRLKQHSVQIASMDNYALAYIENINIFQHIREAINHKEIINLQLEIVSQIVATKVKEIVEKFEELGYVTKQ